LSSVALFKCSIAFGKGVTTGEPGSVQRLILAVYDIDAARAAGIEYPELCARIIELSLAARPKR
jgi:hypothetical protein